MKENGLGQNETLTPLTNAVFQEDNFFLNFQYWSVTRMDKTSLI